MIYNFNAGPAMQPKAVMLETQAELLDWHGCGKSVMEISHHSDEFSTIAQDAEQRLRLLLDIPSDYAVLFLAGGASIQFSMIPLNLCANHDDQADYLHTGAWSGKAITEAKRYIRVNTAMSAKNSEFSTLPDHTRWQLTDNARYLYYTTNETVQGIQFNSIPQSTVPLVADMTSSILSEHLDIKRYGVIFAGVQKNIAPAGMTIAIISPDCLDCAMAITPHWFHYQSQYQAHSMLNTPPTFNWYMAGLMFKWVEDEGGIAVMEQRCIRKSTSIYEVIDNSNGFYINRIDPTYRSKLNVVFHLKTTKLQDTFIQEATNADLHGLKGHKLMGGIRASMYNAMPEEGAQQLCNFMRDFAQRYG